MLLANAGRDLGHRLEEIDAQVDKVQRLIEGASREDAELAAGLATTEPLTTVQKKLVAFEAAIESLSRDIRTASPVLSL
jgi:septal ring factor EnvC (AmiA/AmiB activator)